MLLKRFNVENFRNIDFASLDFGQELHFLHGRNGQGKTNLLEAIGLVSALRSFRTQDMRKLIREGADSAQLFFELEVENQDTLKILIHIKKNGKSIEVDGEQITRLVDFIGSFPTVVLSSDDIQLLRGAPQLRRRLLDLTFSTIDKIYFQSLKRYHAALQERNALLRHDRVDPNLFVPFERILAQEGFAVIERRRSGIALLDAALKTAYETISQVEELPALGYKPNLEAVNEEAYLKILSEGRERDRMLKSTQKGPHRDEIHFSIQGRSAKDFASEGQQRGLVMALRLAQLKLFHEHTGRAPIVLADDVLGELDPLRKEGFWRAVGNEYQIIASGTMIPEGETSSAAWSVFKVEAGKFVLWS